MPIGRARPQNLWDTPDFSGMHILPCKKKKTFDLQIFRQIGKQWKSYSEFKILS